MPIPFPNPGKRFREFINAGAYLDVKPNDDIIDVLGFLAFEMVRELTLGAVALKQSFEVEAAHVKRLNDGSRSRRDLIESGQSIPKRPNGLAEERDEEESKETAKQTTAEEENDGAREASTADASTDTAKQSDHTNEGSNVGEKRKDAPLPSSSTTTSPSKKAKGGTGDAAAPSESACGLFTMPPAKSSPLMTSHVREAFARLQRDRSALSTSGGGPPGGLKRTRVFVI